MNSSSLFFFLAIVLVVAALCSISCFTNAQGGTTAEPLAFQNCANVKAIPGNAHGTTDATCAACDLGAQNFYPCDSSGKGLCYCADNGGTIPPEYIKFFTYCTKAIAVPGNPHNVDDAGCAPCANASQPYYPCDQMDPPLCECAPGHGYIATTMMPETTTATSTSRAPTNAPTPALPTPAPSTAAPPTAAPPTPAPPTAAPPTAAPPTAAPPTAAPSTAAPPTAAPPTPAPPTPAPPTAAPTTSSTTTSTTTTATSTTTTTTITSTTPAATTLWSSCSNVKAIPGQGSDDAKCAVCANGQQAWYPCDTENLCYCASNGGTIPPKYLLPYTYCTKAVAVANNPNRVTDTDCANCANAENIHYPCDAKNVYVLCTCAQGKISGDFTHPPPTTKTPPPPPTPRPTSAPTPRPTPPPTPRPTPAPTPAPTQAPPAKQIPPTYPPTFGNTIEDFRTWQNPECTALFNKKKSTNQCGRSYAEALCYSYFFYSTQKGGEMAPDAPNSIGNAWRGTCWPDQAATFGGRRRNLSLVYYDAGDYLGITQTMAFAQTMLGWSALEYPAAYTSNPQIKYQLLYNLRAMSFHILESWDPNSNTLLAMISTKPIDHARWIPCKDPSRRSEHRPLSFLTSRCGGSDVAADAASALATSAMVLQKFEGASSLTLQKRLAKAAGELFDFGNRFRKSNSDCCAACKTVYRSYSGYEDELRFGATWMHELKGSGLLAGTSYASFNYLGLAESFNNWPWSFSWDNKEVAAQLRLYKITKKNTYRTNIQNRLNEVLNKQEKTAAGLLVTKDPNAGVCWGNLRSASNEALIARLAADYGVAASASIKSQYLFFFKRQIDYTLGSNPLQRSYIVGYGDKQNTVSHHRSAHDGHLNVYVPAQNRYILHGAIVGGPCYSDADGDSAGMRDRNNYMKNEVALDMNAAYTMNLAALAQDAESVRDRGTCNNNGGSAPTPPSAPTPRNAPPSPPGPGIAVTVRAVDLSVWWLQLMTTSNYNPPKIAFRYTSSQDWQLKTCVATGPVWNNHYWCEPSAPVASSKRIVAMIYSSTSASTPYQYSTIKEGGIAFSASIAAESAPYFEPETFTREIVSALQLQDPNRVNITEIPSPENNNTVKFEILPMDDDAYTSKGSFWRHNDGLVETQAELNSSTRPGATSVNITLQTNEYFAALLAPTSETSTLAKLIVALNISSAGNSSNGNNENNGLKISFESFENPAPDTMPPGQVPWETTTATTPGPNTNNGGAPSNSNNTDDAHAQKKNMIYIIAGGVGGFILIIGIVFTVVLRKRAKIEVEKHREFTAYYDGNMGELEVKGGEVKSTNHDNNQEREMMSASTDAGSV